MYINYKIYPPVTIQKLTNLYFINLLINLLSLRQVICPRFLRCNIMSRCDSRLMVTIPMPACCRSERIHTHKSSGYQDCHSYRIITPYWHTNPFVVLLALRGFGLPPLTGKPWWFLMAVTTDNCGAASRSKHNQSNPSNTPDTPNFVRSS